MDNPRWWHIAVSVVAVGLAGTLLLTDLEGWQKTGAQAALAAFLVGWFTVGRLCWKRAALAPWFAVIIIVTVGAAVAFVPFMAILQCVAYPLLWVTLDDTRRAIIANTVLAAAVGAGMWVATESLMETLITATLSLTFSVALGLWITRIAQQGEAHRNLLMELQDAQAQLAAANRDAGVMSERERLAREIHDTIAQDLTGLVLLTQRARRELAAGSTAATDAQLALVEESARQTLAETRSLVTASAPVGLEAGGLGDALERLGERFSRETSVVVNVDAAASPALDRDSEVVLLRIAQEGLANVRKHAGAGSASIRIESGVDDVSLVVADDGAGFDVAAPSTGFGLAGMRERLALVGGTLDVASSPAGTVLTARLPRPVEAAADPSPAAGAATGATR